MISGIARINLPQEGLEAGEIWITVTREDCVPSNAKPADPQAGSSPGASGLVGG
jgi:hypothetical protein